MATFRITTFKKNIRSECYTMTALSSPLQRSTIRNYTIRRAAFLFFYGRKDVIFLFFLLQLSLLFLLYAVDFFEIGIFHTFFEVLGCNGGEKFEQGLYIRRKYREELFAHVSENKLRAKRRQLQFFVYKMLITKLILFFLHIWVL